MFNDYYYLNLKYENDIRTVKWDYSKRNILSTTGM